MKKIKVGVVQMATTDKKEENWQKMKEFVAEAAKSGAQLVLLPEMWNCPYQNSFFSTFAEEGKSHSYQLMAQVAKEQGIYLVGGSIPVKERDKIYNRAYVFNPQGEEIYQYSKVNLFDIKGFQESKDISAGKHIGVFETEYGVFGLCICYDLRFPELFMQMVNFGAEVIFAPSTFTKKTGEMHWELLTRARAVDNECFVVTASIARDEFLCRNAYGHSNIITPYGEVVKDLGTEAGVCVVELEPNLVEEMRKKIPLLQSRLQRRQ